jgi:hypothetical protein
MFRSRDTDPTSEVPVSNQDNTAEAIEPTADEFLQDVAEEEAADSPAETEEATQTAAPKKKARKKRVNKNPKPYPFRSKKDIVAEVESSDDFCLECLGILYERQTASEQAKGTTETRNRAGFMSSHAVVGTKLAKKVADGETLDEEELAQAHKIVCRYGRQLAAHFRQAEIDADPAKAELAALFSAG